MTRNSLSGLLADLISQSENSNEILAKLSESFYTNESFVEVEIFNPETNGKRVLKVPSLNALLNRINALEKNISNLASFDTESVITLPDGSSRKIALTKLKTDISTANINVPVNFNTRNNWFFENMMNPLMVVPITLPPNSKGAQVFRYMLSLDTAPKQALFENQLRGRNDISLDEFLTFLTSNNIQFFLDEETVMTPPFTNRFTGKFSVLNVFDDVLSKNGVDLRVLRLQLDKVGYNDSESPFKETQILRVNDSLIVEDGTNSTRYKVEEVNENTNVIAVSRIEGFSPIQIGANQLSYFEQQKGNVDIDVSIGFNEDLVIFVKPISSDDKVSPDFSAGIAFSTEELTIINENGDTVSMNEYYKANVVDFGQYLYSLAKDSLPPSILGETPNIPVPTTDSFKVLQINNHLFDPKTTTEIKNLNAEKNRLQSLIKDLDKKIQEKRNSIFATTFSSKSIEETEKAELNRLISDREAAATELSSTINNLNSVLSTVDIQAEPKYRIRGFVPIPEPKESLITNPQQVVQFKIRYRYLSKRGDSNEPQQITFTDNTGVNKSGTVPNWIIKFSDPRERIINEQTGQYKWETPDVESSDKLTINQIDIPIRPGESVEFQVKSISEAGYPQSPLESDWSDSILIEFPDDLDAVSPFAQIQEEVKRDLSNLEFQSVLDGEGVTAHVDDSFDAGNRTFFHRAESIFSGFLENGIPQSLLDKLTQLSNDVKNLKAIIERAVGKLVVKIVDTSGNEERISNNTKVTKFAGNYKDEVKNLTVKKGAIVTKTFFLKLENEAATTLEMYARVFGSKLLRTKPSFNDGSGNFDANDTDYNFTRRYDLVPLSLRNPLIDEENTYDFINFPPFSSGQVRGQFIGIRYRAIDGLEILTSEFDDVNEIFQLPNGTGINDLEDCEHLFDPAFTTGLSLGNPVQDFIWKGEDNQNVIQTSDALTILNTQPDSILIHIDHPEIATEWVPNFTTSGFSSAGEYSKSEVRLSKFAPLKSTEIGGKKVMGYTTLSDFLGNTRTPKLGFTETDQYLIGPRSCGAYLFFAPNEHTQITVDGADSLSRRDIEFGPSSAISIPIIFQYRMTDYFGFGSTGLGKIGGDPTGSITQLEYTKTIGFDIFSNDDEKFSFDLEITARYSSKSFSTAEVPVRTFETSVDDLNKNLNTININRG